MNAMKPISALINTLLVMLLGALLAAPAFAQSLNDTVRRVERETGGRILSAETVTSGSREVFRIKVLTPDGRVRVVQEPVPAGRSEAPRSREAPRRDLAPERFERPERSEPAREPPAAYAPRERGYVPRRERQRDAPPPVQRGESRAERAQPRERSSRERRDE